MIILSIARSTFNEAIRRRVLMVLLIFAIAMIGGSFAFSSFLPSTEEKMVIDMGLSAIQLFGVVISVVMAVVMIPAEIDRRTIHTILSKPVSRRAYVLGKYLGSIYTISFNTIVMSLVFLGALYFKTQKFDFALIEAIVLYLLEFYLLMGIAIFFSVLVSPMVNAFICICILILGNLTSYIQYAKTFGNSSGGSAITKVVFQWIYNLVPNFQNFDIGQKIAAGTAVPVSFVGTMAVWTVLYIVFLMLMTLHFFSTREV
jgi:ABC-type transport system involved in multi-copper enzyme maturation permease subunit